MTFVPFLAVQCDLCRGYLTAQMLTGQDPAIVKMVAASPYLALFEGMIQAGDAATLARWELDHTSGHIQPDSTVCHSCVNRLAAMHAWVEQNRMINEQV